MATFDKKGLLVNAETDSLLSFLTRHQPESASETFTSGAPLKWSSGFLTECTSQVATNSEEIAAFALEAGSNLSANGDDTIEVVMVLPNAPVVLEGNLLEASAADHTVTDDDLGANAELTSDANLLGTGEDGWYFEIDAATTAVKICEFDSLVVDSTRLDYKPATGDVNARVRAYLLEAVMPW